jgi:hypothetical protein
LVLGQGAKWLIFFFFVPALRRTEHVHYSKLLSPRAVWARNERLSAKVENFRARLEARAVATEFPIAFDSDVGLKHRMRYRTTLKDRLAFPKSASLTI